MFNFPHYMGTVISSLLIQNTKKGHKYSSTGKFDSTRSVWTMPSSVCDKIQKKARTKW